MKNKKTILNSIILLSAISILSTSSTSLCMERKRKKRKLNNFNSNSNNQPINTNDTSFNDNDYDEKKNIEKLPNQLNHFSQYNNNTLYNQTSSQTSQLDNRFFEDSDDEEEEEEENIEKSPNGFNNNVLSNHNSFSQSDNNFFNFNDSYYEEEENTEKSPNTESELTSALESIKINLKKKQKNTNDIYKLYTAIDSNDLEAVKTLLKQSSWLVNTKIYPKGKHSSRRFHIYPICKAIKKYQGVSLEGKYKQERKINFEIIKELLRYNADPYSTNIQRYTALEMASRSPNDRKILQALLDKTQNTNIKIKKNKLKIALNTAIEKSNTEGMDLLLQYGASADNLLHDWAIKNAKKRILQYVIKQYGYDINKLNFDWNTPLQTLMRKPYSKTNSDIIKICINSGADINIANRYNNTPISSAIKHKKFNDAKILLENGAQLNNIYQNNPQHNNITYLLIDKKQLDLLKLCIKNGLKLDIDKEVIQPTIFPHQNQTTTVRALLTELVKNELVEVNNIGGLRTFRYGVNDHDDNSDIKEIQEFIKKNVENQQNLRRQLSNLSKTLRKETFTDEIKTIDQIMSDDQGVILGKTLQKKDFTCNQVATYENYSKKIKELILKEDNLPTYDKLLALSYLVGVKLVTPGGKLEKLIDNTTATADYFKKIPFNYDFFHNSRLKYLRNFELDSTYTIKLKDINGKTISEAMYNYHSCFPCLFVKEYTKFASGNKAHYGTSKQITQDFKNIMYGKIHNLNKDNKFIQKIVPISFEKTDLSYKHNKFHKKFVNTATLFSILGQHLELPLDAIAHIISYTDGTLTKRVDLKPWWPVSVNFPLSSIDQSTIERYKLKVLNRKQKIIIPIRLVNTVIKNKETIKKLKNQINNEKDIKGHLLEQDCSYLPNKQLMQPEKYFKNKKRSK